ncbi:MAG: hypothetical protein R3335_00720 [Anaerolineales bacterium]|nr:hypothetical protein [Anaerolineales bacterium]
MSLSIPSPWHRRLRLAWYPTAALALVILIASIPGYITMNLLGLFEGRLVFSMTPGFLVIGRLTSVLSFATASLSLGLAYLLFIKISRDRTGLFLAYYLLAYGIFFAGPFEQLRPFWPAAPWVGSFVLGPFLIGPLTTVLIGIFPDGRFVPRWFKWIVPLSAVIFPISIFSGEDLSNLIFDLPRTLAVGSGIIVTILVAITQVYAQVYRYRHVSTPLERQQTKVVLYGIVVWFLLLALSSVTWVWGFSQPMATPAPWWFPAGSMIWTLSTLILPASLTISVLRYRLFEIDLLVNKTLVYGLLTSSLGLLYFSLVTVLQNLVSIMSGQQSAIAIVVSTLVIAALFNPLRRRIQDFIDRRFYRRHYDAAKMLASFNYAVREGMGFDTISLAVLTIVEETLQPETVSLWLAEHSGTRTPEGE